MILVGLTGSIATGKSSVCRFLAEEGAIIIDADALARQAVAPGSVGFKQVIGRFGQKVLAPNGELDRAALRRLIFSDRQAKADLEAIIHPLVLAEEQRLIALAKAADPKAVIVVDLPLLYEIKEAHRFDKVIVVYADPKTQIKRLIDRDGADQATAEEALASQIDIETKRGLADYVVDNRGGLEETQRQVRLIFEQLKALS